MPRRNHVPAYRLHKQSGQAVVTLPDGLGGRKDFLFGPFNSPESRAEYARLLAEWGTGLTGEKPRRLRGRICLQLNIGVNDADAMTLQAVADLLIPRDSSPPNASAAPQAPPATLPDTGPSRSPVEVFISYAHEDEDLRDELAKHLSTLKRQGFITDWHDRKITAGSEWAQGASNLAPNRKRDVGG